MRHYDPHARERAAAFAAARRRSAGRDAEIRAPCKGDDPISQAANEAGGVLIRAARLEYTPRTRCPRPRWRRGTGAPPSY